MKPILAIVLLAVLTLLFYWRIAFTGQILPSYDLFTYFYPYRAFVNASLLQGETPLWNPYIFMGVPGMANIQSAVFYPLNLLTIGLPPPQAVNIAIVVHVFLAGAFMYAFCRVSAALDRPSALVAGIVFMFSGFLSAQVAHINQLSASAWLPLLLLVFDRAYARRSPALAVLGSVVLAVQILAGHPQEVFLSVVGLLVFAAFAVARTGFEPLPKALPETGRDFSPFPIREGGQGVRLWSAILRASLVLAIILVLGVGLVAFQLLPTAELSSLSIRSGGMSFPEAMSFSLPPNELLRSLLPSFVENPYGEFIAYVGFLGLGLAALSVRGAQGRRHPYLLFCLALAAVSFFFAFGGFNPLMRILYKLVPWLGMFRVPARWLFLYTFAVALSAGIGFSLLRGMAPAQAPTHLRRALWRGAATCLGIGLFLLVTSPIMVKPRPQALAIWGGLIMLSAALFWLGPLLRQRGRLAAVVAAALVVELFLAGADLNRTVPPFVYSSLRPSITQLATDPGTYRVLSIASSEYEAGDTRDLPELLGYQPSRRELTDMMSGAKYKEILTPNVSMVYGIATIDGYDGGLLPLKRYVEFKTAVLAGETKADGRAKGWADALLRNQLTHIPDTGVLGALNVKYVVDDKRDDVWIDNTYYDLSTPVALGKGESLKIDPPRFEATALGLVTYLSGSSAVPQGEPVGEVVITDSRGRVTRATLRAGIDTAEGHYLTGPAHEKARPAQRVKSDPGAQGYYAKIKFAAPLEAKNITVTAASALGTLVTVGASLIDDRASAHETLGVNSRLRLVHSGDVKIYENLDILPRAYLVHRARLGATADALKTVGGALQTEVVLADYTGSVPGPDAPAALSSGEGAEIIAYKPGRLAVRAKLNAPGFLVFTESYYPGWRARVDGLEVPIVRANVLFQAVYLPGGEQTVAFEYAPFSFTFGLAVSGVSLLIALAALAAGRFGRLRLP
ncbi:MAG: YfhO family protein [Chloroflexi bacterium]|nr:YfhO family protein [Chloroflexota bacterium]